MSGAGLNRTWPFALLLLAHLLALILFHEAVVMTLFCLWIPMRWLQTALQLIWAALVLSSLLAGIAGLLFPRLRPAYFGLLGLTVVQFLVVALLNANGILSCDAP